MRFQKFIHQSWCCFLASFLFLLSVSGQKIDTVIVTNAYTSYYNYQLHEPVYVAFRLYQAGGDCDRKAFHFKTGDLPYSAKASDYKASGYDQGHLADAKDFAFDCEKEEVTFRFFNCVPQTPKLNRGIWKQFETVIRKDSQTDSLLVVCGSIFGSTTIGPQNIAVPSHCWKIVYSLTSKQVTYCLLFPNDNSDSFEHIELADLKKRLPYKLPSFKQIMH